MGLLDDAIREHLELMRRRGADPNELQRQEREALGPVRRSPGEAYEVPVAEEPAPDAGYLDEEPEEWELPQEEPSFLDRGSELEIDEVAEWESPERGSTQAALPVEPDTAAPVTPPPPAPAAGPPMDAPQEERQHLEQETVEHDIEAEHANGEEDDMLEETPEFLQDTPDHDRLWFEQRPPRDFDLDG